VFKSICLVQKLFAVPVLCGILLFCGFSDADARSNGNVSSSVRSDFAPAKQSGNRIILLRPDIGVTELTTGGLDETKADWANAARSSMVKAMKDAMEDRGQSMVEMPELKGKEAEVLSNYRALFKIVAEQAIGNNLFPSDPLPLHKGRFNWTLGPGISDLARQAGGGDFALIFQTTDSYRSNSRGSAEAVASVMQESIPQLLHHGAAALVDLKSGNIVWMMLDGKMSGDVRTADGAVRRTSELLREFPFVRIAPITQAKATK
jgi:hypothetical protein